MQDQENRRRARSSAPSPPPHFLIPTQPTPLNPLAPSFTPRNSAPDDAADFPLPRLLSSLFRLCASTGYTPSRWGRTSVTLISKLKTKDNPTPAETRPIALLPMFRRLFEILLLPHFDPLGHQWARLNPRQAGFRSGWSCSTAILQVQHEAQNSFPCFAFLDFASAYDLPPIRLIYRRLKQLQVPLATRFLIWSLLTSGSAISLVVNGRQSESFPRRRGFPQGAPLSPLLFNLYLDPLLTKLNSHRRNFCYSYQPPPSPPPPDSSTDRSETENDKRKELKKRKEKDKEKEPSNVDISPPSPLPSSSQDSQDSQTSHRPQDQVQVQYSAPTSYSIAGGWAYADDLAVGAKDAKTLKILIREAEEWAEEWGMRFNGRKCVVMGRTTAYERALRGIWIAGIEMEIVKEVRYLGVGRSGSRILLGEYLEQKVDAMNRLLGGLMAAGAKWSPLTRLAIYRTYCRSLIEFGGPLLYIYLEKTIKADRKEALLKLLERHHARATTWIVGINDGSGNWRVATSMTGLAPPLQRLCHLALGLAVFLHSSPLENPTSALFRSARLSPPSNSYISHLAHLPLFNEYITLNDQRQLEEKTPAPHQLVARQDLFLHLLLYNLLRSSLILPLNRPRGTVDGVLYIPSHHPRHAAIQWRANTFCYQRHCLGCGNTFDRHHHNHALICAPLRNKDGIISPEEQRKIEKEVDEIRSVRDGIKDLGNYKVMDFLIGHRKKEWQEIGIETLLEWERRMTDLRD